MAESLEQASQWHEMCGHDLEVMEGWTWGAYYFCPKSYLKPKI